MSASQLLLTSRLESYYSGRTNNPLRLYLHYAYSQHYHQFLDAAVGL